MVAHGLEARHARTLRREIAVNVGHACCAPEATIGSTGIQRQRLARHPRYVPFETSVDAGPAKAEDYEAGV